MTIPTRSEENRTITEVGQRPKPLTDPADIITLLGRFMACGVLFVLTIAAFVMHQPVVGIGLGVFSLIWQRSTTGLYRRLRDERMAAEAARDAENPAGATL